MRILRTYRKGGAHKLDMKMPKIKGKIGNPAGSIIKKAKKKTYGDFPQGHIY